MTDTFAAHPRTLATRLELDELDLNSPRIASIALPAFLEAPGATTPDHSIAQLHQRTSHSEQQLLSRGPTPTTPDSGHRACSRRRMSPGRQSLSSQLPPSLEASLRREGVLSVAVPRPRSRTAKDFAVEFVDACTSNDVARVLEMLEQLDNIVDRDDERVAYPGWEHAPCEPPLADIAAEAAREDAPAQGETPFEVGSLWAGWYIRDHAVWHAAASGSVDVVQLLLESGADIEAPGYDGSSPLDAAVTEHRASVVVQLIDRGADTKSLPRLREDLRECGAVAARGQSAEVAEKMLEFCNARGCLPEAMLASVTNDRVGAIVARYGEPVPKLKESRVAESVHAERRRAALAMAMGLHPRTGEQSAVNTVDSEAVRDIMQIAFP
eukprot:m51a1_g6824 hypothetical protein (382) ;mRNA; f:21687-23420